MLVDFLIAFFQKVNHAHGEQDPPAEAVDVVDGFGMLGQTSEWSLLHDWQSAAYQSLDENHQQQYYLQSQVGHHQIMKEKEKEKLAYRPRLYLNSSLSLNSVKELRSLNCALRSDSRGWALCGGRGVCEENERLSFNKMAFVVTVLLRFA